MTKVEDYAQYTASKSRADPPLKFVNQWRCPLQDVFSDLRVRSGIKFGLAGLLALYIAEVLRLQYPNWSMLTVLDDERTVRWFDQRLSAWERDFINCVLFGGARTLGKHTPAFYFTCEWLRFQHLCFIV